MGTPIDEPITVGAVFHRGAVQPAWFLWQGRRYAVERVTMRWQTRQGREPILHLGAVSGGNTFELALNQQTLAWSLLSVETAEERSDG